MVKSIRIVLAAVLGLSFAGASAAGPAAPPRVTLYEISERVIFDPQNPQGTVFIRHAVSPLLGFAELGSPLCPSELLISVPQMESCTVIATGEDFVSTRTGTGPVSGTFDVVVNAPGNSSVHVPDLPVISGTFGGNVDLSPAILLGTPLGSIGGSFTLTKMADASGQLMPLLTPITLPFTGTFRLPFGIDDLGRPAKSHRKRAAFYLADNIRTRIPVRPDERSVGFPAVRLEVSFAL